MIPAGTSTTPRSLLATVARTKLCFVKIHKNHFSSASWPCQVIRRFPRLRQLQLQYKIVFCWLGLLPLHHLNRVLRLKMIFRQNSKIIFQLTLHGQPVRRSPAVSTAATRTKSFFVKIQKLFSTAGSPGRAVDRFSLPTVCRDSQKLNFS